MLEYDRINVSEGIDVNETTKSKKCMLCHYCNFFNFKFLTLVMDPIFGMVAVI